MKRLRVQIYNLTCAGCVNHVERVLRQQDGVVWAMVNFAAREAIIIYDPVAFRLPRFIQALKRQGYQVGLGDEPARQLDTKGMGHKLYEWMQQWLGSVTRAFPIYRVSSGDIRKTSQPDS